MGVHIVQRGTLVRVNQNCHIPHLRGEEGIVIGKSKRYGSFQVYILLKKEEYEVSLYYPLEELDVLEGPIEL